MAIKVLYDYRIFDFQRIGGISKSFVENYKCLPSDVNASFSVLDSDNIYLQSLGFHNSNYKYEHFITKRHFPYKRKVFRWYNSLINGQFSQTEYNKKYSIKKLQEGDFDVFHPTFFDDYFLEYLNGKPFVLTIHDMIPELFPEYFDSNDEQITKKKKLAPLASKIIAVSESTKRDIIRILNVPEEKIEVIYHGAPLMRNNSNTCPRIISSPYILFVGERHWYKNFELFVNHVSSVLKRHSDLKVVCTGNDFTDEESVLLTTMGVREKFLTYFFRDDEELYNLYHNAEFFIYPSSYEGFGIPILEAYSAQCPILLNNESCFPEIAGDAAVFFTEHDRDCDLEEKIEMMLSMSPAMKQELIEKQFEQLKKYSWESSANKLANIYKSLL